MIDHLNRTCCCKEISMKLIGSSLKKHYTLSIHISNADIITVSAILFCLHATSTCRVDFKVS